MGDEIRTYIRRATYRVEGYKVQLDGVLLWDTNPAHAVHTPDCHGDETSGVEKSDPSAEKYTNEPGPVRPVGNERP